MGMFLRKVRIALTPRRFFLRSRLANGVVILGQNRKGFGGRGVYLSRDGIEPELEQLERLLGHVGPDAVFVDVGANTGVYSLKAAAHSRGLGTVLAIEPFPEVLATLSRSVRANKLRNMRLRNFCAGARTEPRLLWLNSRKPNSFSLMQRDPEAKCISTLSVSIDELLEWEDLNGLDYLKIDAEGSEEEVLEGARNSILKYRPVIQTEVAIRAFAPALRDYSSFQAPGSPNVVFVPNERRETLALCRELRWNPL